MSHLLHDDIAVLLRAPRLPGRLNSPQTAALLGMSAHDIPVLIRKKLLKPLGRPSQQASKYFGAVEIEKLTSDSVWLGKATQALYDHWKDRNERDDSSPQNPDSMSDKLAFRGAGASLEAKPAL